MSDCVLECRQVVKTFFDGSRELQILRGHEKRVNSASFSPDGARLVTASWDGTARLWDAVSGAEVAVLKGHRGSVWAASFSPDGARVVTASSDRQKLQIRLASSGGMGFPHLSHW